MQHLISILAGQEKRNVWAYNGLTLNTSHSLKDFAFLYSKNLENLLFQKCVHSL